MNRTSAFLVTLASLSILFLLGLAAYLTVYLNEKSITPAKPAQLIADTALPAIEPDAAAITPVPKNSEHQEVPHTYLIVGDSRMVGMRNALSQADSKDSCAFLAKEGEGLKWLQDSALLELKETLKKTPDTVVVFNLGVNDLSNVDNYITLYKELFAIYRDSHFYIMSVNPVNDELCEGASNDEIKAFNHAIQDAFPDNYLDCYSYLVSDGFTTIDGLHYAQETSLDIHRFLVRTLTANALPGKD